MPVGVCKECNVYYKFEDENEAEKFPNCECGAKLIYLDSLDFTGENNNLMDSTSTVSTHTEKKAAQYKNNKGLGNILKYSGLVIIFLGFGLSIFFVTFTYMVLFFLGFIMFVYGKSLISKSPDKWSVTNGLEVESLILQHLKTLPLEYSIFNDIKFPGSKGSIDHIVAGPNGVFIIVTKDYSGKLCIDGNKWYYYKQGQYNTARYNPTDQVAGNEMDLDKFLWDNDISSLDISLNSVVALVNDNFRVVKKPHEYNVVAPADLLDFILNYKCKSNPVLLDKTLSLLRQYFTEFMH